MQINLNNINLLYYLNGSNRVNVSKLKLNGTQIWTSPASPVFGISNIGHITASDPRPTLVRTDDSVGKTFSINSNTGEITSDFDGEFPWNQMTEETDENGNVFINIPELYIRVTYDGTYIDGLAVSNTPRDGGTWIHYSAFKIAKYFSVDPTNLISKPNKTTNVAFDSFTSYQSLPANYGILPYYRLLELEILAIIEYATVDFKGLINLTTVSVPMPWTTGNSIGKLTPSSFDINKHDLTYHGIESLYYGPVEVLIGIAIVTSAAYGNASVYIQEPSHYYTNSYDSNIALFYNSSTNKYTYGTYLSIALMNNGYLYSGSTTLANKTPTTTMTYKGVNGSCFYLHSPAKHPAEAFSQRGTSAPSGMNYIIYNQKNSSYCTRLIISPDDFPTAP